MLTGKFPDTPGTKIYYTINGLKPEPFQNFGPAAKATLLYTQPFLLPAGKKTIKALAISEWIFKHFFFVCDKWHFDCLLMLVIFGLLYYFSL